MKKQYSYYDYNQYNVLKSPPLLVITCLVACKLCLFLLIPMLGQMPFIGSVFTEIARPFAKVLRTYAPWWVMVTNFPALGVLIALLFRIPSAPSWIRWIWRRGHGLLVISLVAETLMLLLLSVLYPSRFGFIVIALLYFNLMAGLYLWRAERLRDVFAEFPAPPVIKR